MLLVVSDASLSDQPTLLVRKLKQCCIIFDFFDPLSDVKSKDIKRLCLLELSDFISKPGVLNSEELYMDFMRMVRSSYTYLRLYLLLSEIFVHMYLMVAA